MRLPVSLRTRTFSSTTHELLRSGTSRPIRCYVGLTLCALFSFVPSQEPIPVEQLVQLVCDLKQSYTQFGGLRPFGVSFLVAGWDEHHGFQLYQSDPRSVELLVDLC